MSDLARFLFDRQADSYEADPAMRELAWTDADIRRFWDDEAQAILEHLDPEGFQQKALAVADLLDEAGGYSVPYRRSRFMPIDSAFTRALRDALGVGVAGSARTALGLP